MTKVITAIALFVCSLLSAQEQFEQGMEKKFGLFATFKPETPFSPKWELDRATAALQNCK
ncbi:hypothetical protein [Flavobacterium sp.]|uniref:hypothetical protein n=1 Tax=Flavobacterium sp. TaxID=239 RepID=UPI001B4FEEBA|nr:hypothetical protein [Flavobacterium sp.]MBP6180644.1 hypothetical protein [Flavobacterium sp.]